MKKILIIGLIVIIAIAATSGCVTDGVSAVAIKNNALQAIDEVLSYKFSSTGISITSSETQSGITNMESITSGSGIVDIRQRRLMMTQAAEFSGDTESTVSATIYIFDDYAYMYSDSVVDGAWTKQEISDSDSFWYNYAHMEQMGNLLEASNVERLDDDVVNGVNCYVLKISADLDKFYETMMAQSGQSSGSIGDMSGIGDLIKEVSAKQWIAKDTNLMMKGYMCMKIEMDMFGLTTSIDMEITTELFDYNLPVDIELPEDAENA